MINLDPETAASSDYFFMGVFDGVQSVLSGNGLDLLARVRAHDRLAKVIILTDGVPRKVSLGKLTLVFRRAAPRNMLAAGRRAGLVVQALRYLKGSPVMSKHVAKLKKDLDADTKKDLAGLTLKLPLWMRPFVQRISQE